MRVELNDVAVRGRTEKWHTVTAQNGQAGAVVIARRGDSILIGEHWRVTTGETELEFPRGLGEPGEDGIQTAIRELTEETGIVARRVAPLGIIFADTGLLTNPIHVVLAEIDVDRTDSPIGPDEEFRKLQWVSPSELDDLIARGAVRDAITLAAYALWRTQGAGRHFDD